MHNLPISEETLIKIAKEAREAANKALAREVPFLGGQPAAVSYGYNMYSL